MAYQQGGTSKAEVTSRIINYSRIPALPRPQIKRQEDPRGIDFSFHWWPVEVDQFPALVTGRVMNKFHKPRINIRVRFFLGFKLNRSTG